MRENGFVVDSTVATGLHLDDGLNYYDFRKAEGEEGFWRISDSILDHKPEGEIFEIPICTMKVRGWQLLLKRVYKKFFKVKREQVLKPEGYYPPRKRVPIFKELIRHLSPQWIMFDFCTLTACEMEGILVSALEGDNKGKIRPLVAIGHPNNFSNTEEFGRFLKRCSETYMERGQARFCTMKELVEHLSL
jgi:hypothetical protein